MTIANSTKSLNPAEMCRRNMDLRALSLILFLTLGIWGCKAVDPVRSQNRVSITNFCLLGAIKQNRRELKLNWLDVEEDFNDVFGSVDILGGRSRINNEKTVNIAEYPYQVSIEYLGRHLCSGVIVNQYFVLTAAHCIYSRFNFFAVRAGTSTIMFGGLQYSVAGTLIHPLYKGRRHLDFDIALMQVTSPFNLSGVVKPLELVKNDDGITEATVTGWGTTNSTYPKKNLETRRVPILENSKCFDIYGDHFTTNLICGGYVDESQNDCTVESGSPLVANGKLVGVAAWAGSCAAACGPDVYVKDLNRMDNDSILDTNLRRKRLVPNEEKVSITEHPYQVTIEFMGRHACGGAIINSHFVVTAAHCLKLNNLLYTIRESTSNLAKRGHMHSIFKVNKHQWFAKEENLIFDVALVEVRPPFTFSEFVKPVAVLSDPEGITKANVTGWGVADKKMGAMKYLQIRPVNIVSEEKCIAVYGVPYTDNLICGEYKEPCTVDDGSPLVANGQLMGITVRAGSCASPPKPDVFLKLANVEKWINDIKKWWDTPYN